MSKLSKHIKWIIAISVAPLLLLSVSVANGGVRWSGMDSELLVNGDRINIWVEWPENHTCSISGEIATVIGVSKDAEVTLLKESMETFGCDGGKTSLRVKTNSDITDKAKKDRIRIKARMRGEEKFPFRIVVLRNGEFLAACEGETDDKKHKADCGELKLEDGWSSFNGEKNVNLGQNFRFGERVKIKAGSVIGNDVEFGDHVHIKKEVQIGNDVVIGDRAKIDDTAIIGNGTYIGERLDIGKVRIGNGVVLGQRTKISDKSTIMDGASLGEFVDVGKEVTIGANVEIGNQVVIKDKVIICDGESIPDGTEIPKDTTLGSC